MIIVKHRLRIVCSDTVYGNICIAEPGSLLMRTAFELSAQVMIRSCVVQAILQCLRRVQPRPQLLHLPLAQHFGKLDGQAVQILVKRRHEGPGKST